MTNLQALGALCTAICSSYYPDSNVLALALLNAGIDADGDATAKDAAILKAAVALVMGYVETGRTENGASVSIDRDAVSDSISYWCGVYGLDTDDVLEDSGSVNVVDDGTHLW